MIDLIKSEKNRKKKKEKSKPQKKKRWDVLSISLFSYINPFIKLCYKIQLPSLTKATPDPLQTLVIEKKLIKICVSHIDKTCRIYTRFASFLNSKIVYCWNISANSKFVCFVFFFLIITINIIIIIIHWRKKKKGMNLKWILWN